MKNLVGSRLWLVAGCWVMISNLSFGQAVGDYRTNGNVTFAAAANWQRYNGAWVAAGAPPTSADGVITIQNGHTATVTSAVTLDQVVGDAGGTLTINSGQTLTFNDGLGTDLAVNGTVNNEGTMTIISGATISFNANSTYCHTQNGGTIPTATWDANSNCNITGITNSTGFTGGLEGQTFGNFTWNCPGQITNIGFFLAANFTVAGDFTVSGTGTFDSNNHVLLMSNTATGYTITVTGNFIIKNNSSFKMNNNTGSCIMTIGGDFTLNNGCYFTIVTGNANSTLSVAEDVNILGGTLDMQEESSMNGTMNIGGNFTLAGSSTIQESATGLGVINFNGSTVQTYSRTGGTFVNTINFNVNNGSILDVGTSLIDGSNGSFTLSAGGGIILGDPYGITTGTTGPTGGNIRVTGTRTFNSVADYTYNGSSTQVTGNALPNTVHNLTINNSAGVNLTGSVTVNGSLGLTSGVLGLNGNTLTISSPGTSLCGGSGTINGNAGSSFVLNNSTATGFPAGIYQNVTINGPGGVTLCGNATVNGTLSLTNGKITLSSYNLTISSPGQISGGSSSSYIIAESTGTLKQYVTSINKIFPIGTTSSFLPVTLNNGGTADYYSVNLFADVTTNGQSGGAQVSYIENLVKVTWRVIENVVGGTTNLVVAPQWNTSNEGLTFAQGANASRTSCSVGFHNGTSWTATSSPASAGGSNPWTLASGNINSFSGSGSFGVGRGCFGDNTPPVISGCPTNITKANDAGLCSAVVTWTEATATDNCTAAGSLVWTKSHLPGAVFPVGTTTVTYTATDAAGNISDVCSFTVTVNDTEKPIAICKDININLNLATGIKTITPADINNGSYDNCGIASISASKTVFDCSNIGVNNIILTITDIHGNSSTCNSIVAVNYAVTPNPIVIPASDVICNGGTTNFILTNNIPVTSWTWIVSAPPQITGGSDDLSGTKTSIQQTLINSDNVAHKAVYTIFPKIYNSCDLTLITAEVWVEPTPQATISTATPVVCNGGTIGITINSPTVTTTPSNLSYEVTVTSTDAAHLGGTASAGLTKVKADLPFTITGTLTNSSDIPIAVTYTVTPKLNGCIDGPSQSVTVTVEPTPQATIVTTTPIVCNGSNINVTINSPTVTTAPSNLSYEVTVTSTDAAHLGGTASAGFTKVKADLPFTITGTLTNSSDIPISVTYTVTPKLNGCSDGVHVSKTIWVNPTPRATPVNSKPAICYAGDTEITLNSPTIMTSGEIRFDYTISYPSGITGNSAPGTNRIQGDVLSFKYRNYNDTVESVYFSITPKVVGLSCPAGNINLQEVQLHPKPVRGITITKPFTCEASTGLAEMEAEISRGANPYNISWTGPVGYTMENSLVITNLYAGYYTLDVTDNLGCAGDTAINIANLSASARIIPLPVLPNIHVSCPGGNDGTARIYVRDGITPPYEYWVVRNDADTLFAGIFSGNYDTGNPSTYRVCTGLMSGIYKLIIRDINGCETYRTAELKEPAPIVVTFDKSNYNGADISCRGGYSDGSAMATVTGGNGSYTYFWYPASGTLAVSHNSSLLDSIPAGKYYLRISDLLGCIKIDSVTLIDPPGMVLIGSEVSHSNDNNYQISCYGASDGYIKMTISGGSGIYTYLWVGPNGYSATTKDISGLKAGYYICTVTDINGCVLTPQPSFTLTQPNQLIIASVSSPSTDGSYNINCNGGTGSVDVTVTGGNVGSYSYAWTTSNGSGIIAGQQYQNSLTAGTYHLVVTDYNGCIATADITLTQPPALITEMIPTHITCQASGFNNGSINLNVSGAIGPYSYLWSTGATVQDISGLTEGYYYVTVTDANGCQKTDSARVNLPPPLAYDQVLSVYNGFNISCYGKADGAIQINPTSGTPPYIFSWQGPGGFSASTKDITGLRTGQYILHITDSNLCTELDTINLTEPGKLSMVITPSLSLTTEHNINCAGGKTGTITVEAVNNAGAAEYLWANGEIGNERTGLMAGNYKVITTDLNGCSADSVITLSEPDSIRISFSVTQPFCTDMPDGAIAMTVTGGTNSGYTYLWSDNSATQNITTAVSGLYSVTVTDANGCSARDSVMIHPINDVCLIIPNAISTNGDLINDEWNIGLKELYPEMEVKIFNRWGELIWKSARGYGVPWDGRSKGNILPIDSYHYTIDLHNGSRPLIGHVTIVK